MKQITLKQEHPLIGKEVRVFIKGDEVCLNNCGQYHYSVEYICDTHIVCATWETGYETEKTFVLFPMRRIEELDTIGTFVRKD